MAKQDEPRMGRPPFEDPADRRTNILRIRVTPEERDKLDEAAGQEKTSTWARRVLLAAAKRILGR